MSSSRPINGETHQAPAFAASNACVGEKHNVTLTTDAFAGQAFGGLQSFGNERTLHDNVFVELGQFSSLFHDRIGFYTDDFRADGTIDEVANLQ